METIGKYGWEGRSANIIDIEGENGEIIYHPNWVGSKMVESDTCILVKKDCVTFKEMKAIFDKAREYNKIALEFIESKGGTSFRRDRFGIGGGVESILFENDKPSKEWKAISRKRSNEYVPAKKDSQIAIEIEKLPVVKKKEMTRIFGFPDTQFVGNRVYFSPGIETVNEGYILDVSAGCIIAIKEGMQIIKKSEYYALKGE